MSDPVSGISIRVIREFDISAARVDRFVARLWSGFTQIECAALGHTFRFNVGEARCNICGVANPAVCPRSDAHLGAIEP